MDALISAGDSITLVQILLALFVVVGSSFTSTLIWLGKGVMSKLENLNNEVNTMNITLLEIKSDLKADLAEHETRISIIEDRLAHAVERRKGL